MGRHRRSLAGMVALLSLSLATAAYAYNRSELAEYEQKELKAPEFCLKDFDGKTHCLKDYLAKGMFVAVQTGSST